MLLGCRPILVGLAGPNLVVLVDHLVGSILAGLVDLAGPNSADLLAVDPILVGLVGPVGPVGPNLVVLVDPADSILAVRPVAHSILVILLVVLGSILDPVGHPAGSILVDHLAVHPSPVVLVVLVDPNPYYLVLDYSNRSF